MVSTNGDTVFGKKIGRLAFEKIEFGKTLFAKPKMGEKTIWQKMNLSKNKLGPT